MDESFKSKRVKFLKGRQRAFLLNAKKELGLTRNEFSKLLGISIRGLTDWKNEKITLPIRVVNIICGKTGELFPKNTKMLDNYWYVSKGAKKGGLANYKKYGTIGNPEKRKKKWWKWWNEKGKYTKHEILEPWPFKKPKYSKDLAEFVGIVLGDGGMTKNQVTITLHCVDDLLYSDYVVELIKKIFNLTVFKHKKKKCNAFDIRISRVGLVGYLVDEIGLKIGNKVKLKVDIPRWIKKKTSFQVACLRGLVDTDGSFFTHNYKSKGKSYSYIKIGFTSRSGPLLKSTSDILTKLKINHRITSDTYSIRIEAKRDVKKYLKMVGTHNPKHKKRSKIIKDN